MLKLILTAIVMMLFPGLIALIIILIVKKNKKKVPAENKAEPVRPASPETGRYPGSPEMIRRPLPDVSGKREINRRPLPDESGGRRERTVMLTYTTLILKDKDRPVRMYKADLLQPVFIGRDRNSSICLSDPSVSRTHLKVFRSGGLVYAENLSHANGTKINGRYLTETKELVSGNLLELGAMKFLVEID